MPSSTWPRLPNAVSFRCLARSTRPCSSSRGLAATGGRERGSGRVGSAQWLAKARFSTTALRNDTPQWPLIKKRSTGLLPTDDMSGIGQNTLPDDKGLVKSHIMLRICGLSKNVSASDFYRISKLSLSQWDQSIKKVQQERDTLMFEPTGCFSLTFSTAEAAANYAKLFQRLHKLAQCRANSRSGLWQTEVPLELQHPGSTPESLEAELASFTIASGTQIVSVDQGRVRINSWATKMRQIIASDRLVNQPPLVMLEVTPVTGVEAIASVIQADGKRCGASWATAELFPLDMELNRIIADNKGVKESMKTASGTEGVSGTAGGSSSAGEDVANHDQDDKEDKDGEVEEEEEEEENDGGNKDDFFRFCRQESLNKKQMSDEKKNAARCRSAVALVRLSAPYLEGKRQRRCLIAFPDESEARRFHRHWNGRWLRDTNHSSRAPRHAVRTQVIEW